MSCCTRAMADGLRSGMHVVFFSFSLGGVSPWVRPPRFVRRRPTTCLDSQVCPPRGVTVVPFREATSAKPCCYLVAWTRSVAHIVLAVANTVPVDRGSAGRRIVQSISCVCLFSRMVF